MRDRDPGSSAASVRPPGRPPTRAARPARPGWLPWTMVVATLAGAMAAAAFGGRPVGTVALPPAATITPRPLTAAHGAASSIGIGSVTVVSPVRPVEVYDAQVDAGAPNSSENNAPVPSVPSGGTRTGTPGSSGASGPVGNAGASGPGAGGGGGTTGPAPGSTTPTTTTTIPPNGSTDGSDDGTGDGSDDSGETGTTTVGTGPVDNVRVGTSPTGT